MECASKGLHMQQFYSNSPRACDKLRANQLAMCNWNNENPLPDFQSFCILGDRKAIREVLLYPDKHMTMASMPVRAELCDNGRYSFFKLVRIVPVIKTALTLTPTH